MIRGLKVTLFVMAAVVVGVLSAKPAVWLISQQLAVHDGPWATFADTGSRHANPYVRAVVARIGLYALSSHEAVYYTAFRDSQGYALNGRCTYQVKGASPPAGWWSLTLYGSDNYLVANPEHRYSWNAGDAASRPDGGFRLLVSSTRQSGNWLPAPAHGRFSLTLRLYKPSPSVLRHLGSIPLPSIVARSCQ